MFILSQILVLLADILYVVSMLNKNKNGLVFYLIVSDIFFASHYLCLGGWTGGLIALVDTFYLIVIYILGKKGKTKYNIFVTIGAMIISITLAVLTWNGPMSLLPMFAMIIYLTTMMFTNVIVVKAGALSKNMLNVVYMISIGSYFGAGLEVCLMISAIAGIIINVKKTKQQVNSVSK